MLAGDEWEQMKSSTFFGAGSPTTPAQSAPNTTTWNSPPSSTTPGVSGFRNFQNYRIGYTSILVLLQLPFGSAIRGAEAF